MSVYEYLDLSQNFQIITKKSSIVHLSKLFDPKSEYTVNITDATCAPVLISGKLIQ